METEKIDQIKDKIEKLLRKAEGARDLGSLEEEAAFAAKATELLIKYNLSLSDVKGKEPELIKNAQIDLSKIHSYNKTDGDWLTLMYVIIARYNMCRVIKINNRDRLPVIMILGDSTNMELVMYIAGQLVDRLKPMMGRRWNQYGGKEKKGTFKRAYYSGACSAIELKLIQQKKQMESDNSHITTMVVSNDQAIADKVNDLFGDNIKTKQKKASKGMDGFIIGAKDGRELEINKGLENQASNSPKLK